MPDLQAEYESLLELVDRCPVALAELADDGTVRMMNPAGARMLLPVAGRRGLDNLFDVLDAYLPALRGLSLQSSGDQVLLDDARMITGWDESASRLFGFSPAEALTRALVDVIAPLSSPETEAAMARALDRARDSGSAELEGWLARSAGRCFWGEVLITRRVGSLGRAAGFTVAFRDATRRRRERDHLLARANTDGLTGLANRRHFEDLAASELARRRRDSDHLCIAMVDADHFKRVNDTYGHATGDAVLRALARACRQSVREIDLVARLGGEEFVVLMPQTDVVGARAVAERIRAAAASLQVDHEGEPVSLTVSVGVAAIRESDDIDAVLDRADAALYRAKQAGRDRVVVAPPPTTPLPDQESP